jgi:hypothetical protein
MCVADISSLISCFMDNDRLRVEQAAARQGVCEALKKRLEVALREEVGLLERIQALEEEAASLRTSAASREEEGVAAAGGLEAALVASGEEARGLREALEEDRALYTQVCPLLENIAISLGSFGQSRRTLHGVFRQLVNDQGDEDKYRSKRQADLFFVQSPFEFLIFVLKVTFGR